MLDPFDEVRPQALGRARLSQVRYAVQEMVEHRPDLHAGQIRSQAEARPTASEGNVRVGIPRCVEALGRGEDRLIAIGRDVEKCHLVTRSDLQSGTPCSWSPAGGSS
jgi:hypothetical protein